MTWIPVNQEAPETPPAKEILDALMRPVDPEAVKVKLRAIRPDLTEETIAKTMDRWPFLSIGPSSAPIDPRGPSGCRGRG